MKNVDWYFIYKEIKKDNKLRTKFLYDYCERYL